MTPPPGGLDDTVIRAGTGALSRPPVDARLRHIPTLDTTGMILSGLAYLLAATRLARLLGVGGTLVITVGGLMLTIGTGIALSGPPCPSSIRVGALRDRARGRMGGGEHRLTRARMVGHHHRRHSQPFPA
ncbi:hypothetical protein GCM10010249_59930 [Streptomyces roseolilacinus]|uniref:Uncharacterized protein n=1 Tax=Streptomyces roseolilacinus TaxID=66904 RepID=A0A918EMJ4_9ACTN|nr:hypothetical protein GCM10010249_59930 [Streptomyces roseolilacinus]